MSGRVRHQRDRHLVSAEAVRELRVLFKLTQAELAARLGVTRRTVIRGEQRGLELPWGDRGPRAHVWRQWCDLQAAAQNLRIAGLLERVDALEQDLGDAVLELAQLLAKRARH